MDLLHQIDRDKMIFMLRHNDIPVKDFHFNMTIAGDVHTFFIQHFGYIKSLHTDEIWNPIDFLDEHFSQKRSTIINNIIKLLNLKSPDAGAI